MQADAQSRNRQFSTVQGRTPGGSTGISVAFDRMLQGWIDTVAPCPWTAHAGSGANYRHRIQRAAAKPHAPLYTPEQRRRRDETPWTLVQGVLAPLQFLVFAVSLFLVLRYLATGEGYVLATASVIIKTLVLYLIMVTGAVWEKVVFGRYLFAPAFFWEDVFSMLVLALHTAYIGAVLFSIGTPHQQMMIALAAYFTYLINAGQFLWKLRAARMEGATS
ncbi:MAG: 2-vinyl bacteriochlorophyllide hydratase [Oceanicaulis sp.]|nr:2-vinyl bacteriochlorophyllide hydratase [Oceanicaulis sp.]